MTVFIAPPATGSTTYEYGLRDATNPDRANGGWVWVGSNGTFQVPAGATAEIPAPGMTFAATGKIDLKVTLDTGNLLPPFTYTAGTTTIQVKGSAWGWAAVTLVDDGTNGDDVAGDGIFTLVLSKNINSAVPPYPGLLKTGDKAEFVWMIGGSEYKDPGSGDAASQGVAGFTMSPPATTWVTQPVQLTTSGFINTYVQAP